MYVKQTVFLRKEIKFYCEYLVENGIVLNILHFDTQDDFWEVIRTFQNVILSRNDLFIPIPPSTYLNNQSKKKSKEIFNEISVFYSFR